jgi:Ras-related GTP-binding protein C/D
VQEELEDYPYHTLQSLDPSTNFSDTSVAQGIAGHLMGETRFEVTSVHDVSLRDAWSKVLQGVMEMLPAVESLLLNFTEVRERVKRGEARVRGASGGVWSSQIQSSGMDNSYLFDMASRVVLATDNRHKNEVALEQVTEYLSRFLQFRELYK